MNNALGVHQQNLGYGLKECGEGYYRCDQIPGYFRMSKSDPNKCYYIQDKQVQDMPRDYIQSFIAQKVYDINQLNNSNKSNRELINLNYQTQNWNLPSGQQFQNQIPQTTQPYLNQQTNQQQIIDGQMRQRQEMTFKEQQILQEIQYYVYQDLANMLGMLAEVQAVFQYFQESQEQSYLPIAINRLVLQSNISNGVHYDCSFQYQNQKEIYLKEKEYAKYLFKQYCPNLQVFGNQKINECLTSYENSLSKQVELQQIVPIKIEQSSKFNQQTLEKMISGMSAVDQTMQQIQEGKYKKLSEKDIERIVNERRQITFQKLAKIFPNTKMKYYEGNQEKSWM